MDAASRWSIRRLVLLVALATLIPNVAESAQFRTTNFIVVAPTAALAREVGEASEKWRRDLSIEWLGKEMPAWSRPCPIKAEIASHLGAGGVTTFVFDRGEVFDWNMTVSGSRERVLDSVLPHEITHTIFASHFRQPLPRWADEGACTTVEHQSEIAKQEHLLLRFLKTGKGIPFGQMFAMKEYPPEVLPLYAQGHSLTRYLIGQKGQAAFLAFLSDGMSDENWRRAVQVHYGHESLFTLQNNWLDWVKKGRPVLAGEIHPRATLASNLAAASTIVRGQSPQPLVPQPLAKVQPASALQDITPRNAISPASTSYESAYSRAARAQNSRSQSSSAGLRDASRTGGNVLR